MKRQAKFSVTLLVLLILHESIDKAWIHNIIHPYPLFAKAMLMSCLLFILIGSIFKDFKLAKLVLAISVLEFLILCICLFYSRTLIDFISFILCMSILLQVLSKVHICIKTGKCKELI